MDMKSSIIIALKSVPKVYSITMAKMEKYRKPHVGKGTDVTLVVEK